MRVAIIPARGGSKRIPRKNIKNFCGQPMIGWSIAAAHASKCFDRVIVSTDDSEIAKVAEALGAEVPFMRPEALSGDHVGTMEVLAHAVSALTSVGEDLHHVCCIYATAPFVRPEDIKLGFRRLIKADAKFAFSVTSYAFPIQRALRITKDDRVEMFNPQHFNSRSQDLEAAWHDAGQFYWGTARAWLDSDVLFNEKAVSVILPRYRVQDIDTLEDWVRAEWMFKAMQAKLSY